MRRNRTATLMGFFVVFCLLPFQEANAVFKVNETTPNLPQLTASATPPMSAPMKFVVESGRATPLQVNSMGSDLPLNLALERILPADWEISRNSQPNLLLTRASWDASQKNLPEVLESIGQKEQLRFYINWDKKRVTVLPVKMAHKEDKKPYVPQVKMDQKPKIAAFEKTAEKASTPIPQKAGKPQASQPEVSDAVYLPQDTKIVIWELQAGSLRQQLEKWCSEQKWTMVWNSSLNDYLLPVSASFKGEFKAIIHEAFMILRKTSDCGLRPKFYKGNNVVEVRDI